MRNDLKEFEKYMAHLSEALGHCDRHAGLRGYCSGLMAALARKSVEPMAAHLDPLRARSRHQSLHHFVAAAPWSDERMLQRVCQWVVPRMGFRDGAWWVIGDTGFPKQGRHSVGVARQCCGMLAKQDNCQVAVSTSLACEVASLPVAWQLYLPPEWADDRVRRQRAGVPAEVSFATKPAIALRQIERLLAQGAPRHCVLADASYGAEAAFRERLSELDVPYVVGIPAAVAVWPPGCEPSLALAHSDKARVPLGRHANRSPQSVKALACELTPGHWHDVTWRQGSNAELRSRFARVRVRTAGGDSWRGISLASEWLLVDWPEGHGEPLRYWLSTLGEDIPLDRMVYEANMRWRIERDHQDLKRDVGLADYEGRGWRGFHHHASLSIASYGFLLADRLQRLGAVGAKKNDPWRAPAAARPATSTRRNPASIAATMKSMPPPTSARHIEKDRAA